MSKKSSSVIPEGMHTVTPVMYFNGNCRQAIDLYKKVFNAQVAGIYDAPDGKSVWHAMIKIGNANIMMSDAMPGSYEKGPDKSATASIWLYVDKCDDVFNTAVKNSFKPIMPVMDMFWGDRFGKVQDPFGHTWGIATRQWEYTPEEMKEKEKEMMAQMLQQ
jgi:PhnB protein